ncbi:hypothetical protein LUZ60_007197 [Juncus effusus]|nr:hypothetical protein LUZ60_007197 [Juncus effusus]
MDYNYNYYYPSSSNSSPSTSDFSTVSSAPPKRPAGRTKFRETRHPIYKGVRQRGTAGRWVCEVREPNSKSRIWLGTFPTADMAARAHDVAAIILRGRSACLNFADSASMININPETISGHRDIQRAAMEFAEYFRPREMVADGTGGTEEVAELEKNAVEFQDYGFEEMACEEQYYQSMAEGLMVDPPLSNGNWDDGDGGDDVSLWSY